jgi:hypothetical protein
VLLRLHYTMENFISVGQFARRIRDVFGDDRRFRYFFVSAVRMTNALRLFPNRIKRRSKRTSGMPRDFHGLLVKTKPTFAMPQREIRSSSGLLAGWRSVRSR